MTDVRKVLSEQEAASYFVRDVMKGIKDAWPTIRKDIRDISIHLYSEELFFDEEEKAALDFTLAVLAQDLEAVTNLYNKEQADRIEILVFKCLSDKDKGQKTFREYSVDELKKYRNQLHTDPDPLYAVAIRLLQHLFGNKYHVVKININGKSFIDPILLSMINPMITICCGFWKTIKDNYDLVEDDLSSLAASYVKLLHPYYDELCRIIFYIDGAIHNTSAIGIFIAHIAFTKIKISNHPKTNQIAELFLNKWLSIIILLVPSTDKSRTREQLTSDFHRTLPNYVPRLTNTLKSDMKEEDRYNEMLLLTAELHIEATGNNSQPNYSSVISAAQVVHRIALDILHDIHVPKDVILINNNIADHKSNVINSSSESNPIILFRPSNFDTAVSESLVILKESGAIPNISEMPNGTFTGMFSEMIKMSWLETKLGKENIDFTLGDREYLKGTSIQKQVVTLKNGARENFYFDFSSFGEKF